MGDKGLKEIRGDAAIAITGVAHSYGSRVILTGIHLTIDAGRFTVLLGRNGCGKSTLFRLVAGFEPLTTGEVRIFGQPLSAMKARERARLLGFMAQQHRAVFPFTVTDVVLTGRAGRIHFSPGVTDIEASEAALERIGIAHLAKRLFTELSGGEQQLVMLARVMAQEPRIILLDEPISHLDLAYQARVMTLLRSLCDDGFTVVAILHDPNVATLNADRLVCLSGGGVFADSGEGGTLSTETLEEVYGMKLVAVKFAGKNLVLHG
jgi:iron complex transport system ATP-binding protein